MNINDHKCQRMVIQSFLIILILLQEDLQSHTKLYFQYQIQHTIKYMNKIKFVKN